MDGSPGAAPSFIINLMSIGVVSYRSIHVKTLGCKCLKFLKGNTEVTLSLIQSLYNKFVHIYNYNNLNPHNILSHNSYSSLLVLLIHPQTISFSLGSMISVKLRINNCWLNYTFWSDILLFINWYYVITYTGL